MCRESSTAVRERERGEENINADFPKLMKRGEVAIRPHGYSHFSARLVSKCFTYTDYITLPTTHLIRGAKSYCPVHR